MLKFLTTSAMALAAAVAQAIAAPISIEAGQQLVVDFTLQPGSSTSGPVENSLLFTMQAPAFSGQLKIEIFEDTTLVASQVHTYVNTNFIQGEFFSTVAPTGSNNVFAAAPAANFAVIDDGIANGRAVFTFGAPAFLPNDPSIYISSVQPFLVGGAVIIQTLQRTGPNSLRVDQRNVALTSSVSVTSPVPVPGALPLFGGVLAAAGAFRRFRAAKA